MQVSDQPGRLVAVCVFAPALVAMGTMLRRGTRHGRAIGRVLCAFGACFFVYETFWLTRAAKCAVMEVGRIDVFVFRNLYLSSLLAPASIKNWL